MIRIHDAALPGSEFQDVDLSDSNFHDVNMDNVSFSATRAYKARLHNVSLENGQFEDVDLKNAIFRHVDFENSSIRHASLANVSINDCNLEGLSINGYLVTDLLILAAVGRPLPRLKRSDAVLTASTVTRSHSPVRDTRLVSPRTANSDLHCQTAIQDRLCCRQPPSRPKPTVTISGIPEFLIRHTDIRKHRQPRNAHGIVGTRVFLAVMHGRVTLRAVNRDIVAMKELIGGSVDDRAVVGHIPGVFEHRRAITQLIDAIDTTKAVAVLDEAADLVACAPATRETHLVPIVLDGGYVVSLSIATLQSSRRRSLTAKRPRRFRRSPFFYIVHLG